MRYFTNKKGTRTKVVAGKGKQANTLTARSTSGRYRTRHRKGKRK